MRLLARSRDPAHTSLYVSAVCCCDAVRGGEAGRDGGGAGFREMSRYAEQLMSEQLISLCPADVVLRCTV